MSENVISKKPKWGRTYILTIGSDDNQIVIEDLYREQDIAGARRVSFNITSALGDYTQGAIIQIYNLSTSEIKQVTKIKTPITLQAGYYGVDGQDPPVIYQGNIQYPNSQRVGPDIVTTLVCFAYGDSLISTPQLSFEQGASLTDIISSLDITNKDGDSISYEIIGDDLSTETLTDDYNTGSDNIRKVLNTLAINFNFRWWCDSITEQLIIIEQGSQLESGEILLVNAGTGLIREPELTYYGLNFESSLEPSLRFEQHVKIEFPRGTSQTIIGTDTYDELRALNSAIVAVTGITHKGDTKGNMWNTKARANWLRDSDGNIITG